MAAEDCKMSPLLQLEILHTVGTTRGKMIPIVPNAYKTSNNKYWHYTRGTQSELTDPAAKDIAKPMTVTMAGMYLASSPPSDRVLARKFVVWMS